MLICPVCDVDLYKTPPIHNDRNNSCSQCECRFDIGNRRGLVPGSIIRLHKIVSEGKALYDAFDIVIEAIIIANKKHYGPISDFVTPQPDELCSELINLAVLWFGSDAEVQLEAMGVNNAMDVRRIIMLLLDAGVLVDGDPKYFDLFTDPTDFKQRVKHKISTMHGSCRKCGYDLRANASGMCPECGELLVATGTKS